MLAKPHRSEFRGDGEFLILVDRNENMSLADVRVRCSKRPCHVLLIGKNRESTARCFRRA